ncbi:ribosome silencing factor RsfS [Rothia kristinae]|uniref:Ribosomal silencing factor RsfS n=1 Tax=Rothia kristinae TaxID=37923 RepID=A0A199PBC2_9MICC|nr:ribosome silencing factor [Rothia kristinae]OAX51751.1 ribosome silencing factor RsfS [Rothia kristinae]OAX58243.1 ribosome silencing factor RsfS [Rothia kristinae]
MTAAPESVQALRIAARAAADKHATQLNAYDVSEAMGLIDGFLLASAANERLVDAIVDEVEDQLREQAGIKPVRREGKAEGRWVLLDFGDIVVHVQHEQERVFYALDRLWSDAPRIPLGVEEELVDPEQMPDSPELAQDPAS